MTTSKTEKIKVLWIVNMLLPPIASHLGVTTSASGTWMDDLLDKISERDDIELGIACVYGEEYKAVILNGVTYFMLPGNGKTMLFYSGKLTKYWDMVEKDFSPDIVHVHGTEYSHALPYMRAYPEKEYLLTIQGVIGKIAEKNDGELPIGTLLANRTFRENLHFNGMLEKKILMKKNVKYEKELIRGVKYATGRTDWDKAYMQGINPDIHYFRAYYNLRAKFYDCDKWDIGKAEKKKIYGSTACSLPLKGGHIIIEALALVKKIYPDVRAVFIAPSDGNGRLVARDGYTKYISKLIKKHGLEDNVYFYSRLNTDQVIETMNSCRLCVIPSAMENASATLREAMDLGVPSVAAFRGGMVDLITDGIDGFHYDYGEYEVLAQKIIRLIEDDELAKTFSENSKQKASIWHNRQKNVDDMCDIYFKVFSEE